MLSAASFGLLVPVVVDFDSVDTEPVRGKASAGAATFAGSGLTRNCLVVCAEHSKHHSVRHRIKSAGRMVIMCRVNLMKFSGSWITHFH